MLAIAACWTLPVLAAESALAKSFEDARAELPAILQQLGVSVTEEARTERFALVIGRSGSGTQVTIAIRSLQQGTRARVSALTDGPRDSDLEQRLVAALLAKPQ